MHLFAIGVELPHHAVVYIPQAPEPIEPDPIHYRSSLATLAAQLRVECARCSRCVEIQRLDAVKLYGPHAIWKDVGQRLLDDGCQVRTGRHEEDGCWPAWIR
jgi:hypothetical protein